MALRFRKSIKIAPGVRLNVGMKGMSLNVGPRGASVSFTRRGTYANMGLAGTGIHSRQLLSQPKGRRAAARQPAAEPTAIGLALQARICFDDDGQIRYFGPDDQPLSADVVTRLRKEHKAVIVDGLHAACAKFNSEMDAVGSIHADTPPPLHRREHQATPFDEEPPVLRVAKFSLLERLLPPLKAKALQRQQQAQDRHNKALAAWHADKAAHDLQEAAEVRRIADLHHDVGVMAQELEAALEVLDWPRETLVAYDILDGGVVVALDVDLPELEDMPRQVASVPVRADRLAIKELAEARVRELYARHIHAVVFRLIGVVFNRLPTAARVVASGFSQRADKATGHEQDDYLVSVDVRRTEWAGLNFGALQAVDPLQALQRFELRREMSKSYILRAVEPFTLG